jgi:hypothetical protein
VFLKPMEPAVRRAVEHVKGVSPRNADASPAAEFTLTPATVAVTPLTIGPTPTGVAPPPPPAATGGGTR